MSSAIVMFVMCLHHSSSCSQEHHLSDSPWIGLQVSAVVRGATRCDVPFTTSSSPPSKSSQGVTIQPQEVALGYSHGGAIEHENIAKQIFNPFNQQSNTVDTDSRSHPVNYHHSQSGRTFLPHKNIAVQYGKAVQRKTI